MSPPLHEEDTWVDFFSYVLTHIELVLVKAGFFFIYLRKKIEKKTGAGHGWVKVLVKAEFLLYLRKNRKKTVLVTAGFYNPTPNPNLSPRFST